MASASLADGLVGLGPAPGGASPWLGALARVGFAAKGFVYVLISVLAAQAALGPGSPASARDALALLRGQAFGHVLLLMAALGIAAYVAWRLMAAIFNPEKRSAVRRVGYLITVVIYSGLAVEAVRLALGGASAGSGDDTARHWTAQLMAQPFGLELTVAIAAGIAAYGLHQLYRAWTADVGHDLRLVVLRRPPRTAVIACARAGLAARGIVFLLVAGFLARAALRSEPAQARGMAGALRALQLEPYGPFLLGGVALGLLAYGVHQFVRARYQRIGPTRR